MAESDTPKVDLVHLSLPNGIGVRTLRESDASDLSHHANDKRVTINLRDRFPSPYTVADANTWFALQSDPQNWVASGAWSEATGSQGKKIPVNFAITLNDQAIGGIGLEFDSDIYFRSAELGYWLSAEHWSKGIMGAVAPVFVDWAWRTFGILLRINARVRENNIGSQKVLAKAGFEVEGRRKNAIVKNGVLDAEILLGTLRPENP